MDDSAQKYLFHDYELDAVQRVLRYREKVVSISGKAFDILVELVRKRGEVVTKEQLLDTVWHDRFVEENNLTVQISAIRKILGEKKGANTIIVTIPGTGYSFVAPVELSGNNLALAGRTPLPATQEPAGGEALIGRDRELAEIGQILEQRTARLITLTGIGGCGKTRLAREVVDRFYKLFDAAYFVGLAEVRKPDSMAGSIVEQLGLRQQVDVSATASLTSFFGTKNVLLVLDNFEQIIEAAGVLKVLFAGSTGLVIIVTSRAPLRLREELEFKIGPLELPPDDSFEHAGSNLEHASVRLFVIRALAARRSFVLNELNAVAISRICRRLDGLPLAIELAAARIKILSPEDILSRLRKSLDLLTGGGPELPGRQRTIRDTLEWSYGLLSDDEQRAFRSLAVFGGGFTIEAAEATLGMANRYSASILDLIAALADSGLLTARDQPDGRVRLGMLEIVREFALEHLEAADEIDAVRKRHAEYFLELAESAEPHLTSSDSVAWIETLNHEIDNIRRATQFSLTADGEIAARIVAAVRYYWINRSQLTEGCHWLESALEVSGRSPVDVRFKLIAGLGSFYRLRGDNGRSRENYLLALDEATKNDRQDLAALAIAGLGTVARIEGQIDEARKCFEKALTISRKVHDQRGISISLNCLADVMLYEGERTKARECLVEALSIYRDTGQSEAECNNLNILGRIELEDGENELAYSYYSQAMVIARSLDNKINTIEALIGFAAIAASAGNGELAATFSGAAGKLREAIDYKLEPDEEAFHQRYLERAKAALDECTFSSAIDFGRSSALSKLVELTGSKLEDLSTPRRSATNEIIIETRSTSTITIEQTD